MENRFRSVTIKDAQMIFDWMNDPQSRAASINTAPLVYENHCKWLESKIKDRQYHLQLAEVDGVPVGYFRMEITNDVKGKG